MVVPYSPHPDLILYRARLYTVDAADRVAEAVAIKDGRFVAVGSTDDVRALAGSTTRQIDLGGRAVVPGFIDAHVHGVDGHDTLDGPAAIAEIAAAKSLSSS
jgi:hypothetical protein